MTKPPSPRRPRAPPTLRREEVRDRQNRAALGRWDRCADRRQATYRPGGSRGALTALVSTSVASRNFDLAAASSGFVPQERCRLTCRTRAGSSSAAGTGRMTHSARSRSDCAVSLLRTRHYSSPQARRDTRPATWSPASPHDFPCWRIWAAVWDLGARTGPVRVLFTRAQLRRFRRLP